MKIKIYILICTLLFASQIQAQIVGSPNLFSDTDEEIFVLGFNYDLSKIEEGTYLYTLLPILNNNIFEGEIEWVSSNEFAASINQKGEVTLLDPFAFGGVTFTATIKEGVYKDTKATQFNPLFSQGEGSGFTNLTGGQIIVNTVIEQRSTQPIQFVLFPSGNRDNSAFGAAHLYSVSDESIATISNGKITGHQPGTVTINATSSVDENISASIKVTVLFKQDETEPILSVENYEVVNDTIVLQRNDTITIPSVIAEDVVDGELTVQVTETGATFNGSAVGIYPIKYTAIDAAENEAILDVFVKIVDTIPPTISLTDTNLNFDDIITAKQGEGLTIPEATAIDDDNSNINVVVDDAGFNADVIGFYKIKYSATDALNNTEERFINLEVTIGNEPSLTIDGFENNTVININQNQSFTIPSATAIDAQNNNVDVVIDDVNSFDFTKPGSYQINYKATDRFDLVTEKSIQINVKDVERPEITNAQDFQYLQRILTTSPSTVTTITATDNVGVVNYSITELNSLTASTIYDVEWWTRFYRGSISIDSNGVISATVPTNEDFTHRHQHYFRIEAIDAEGNKSASSFLTLSHINEEQPEIKIKEFVNSNYAQINFDDSGNLHHEITKQENLKINDTLAIFNANIPNYTFERYELVGTDASNFDLTTTNQNETYLVLKNTFDTSIKTEHNITLNVYGKLNPSDPETLFPVSLKVKVLKVEELAPEIPSIQTEIENSTTVTVNPSTGKKEMTLMNITKANNGIIPDADVLGEALFAFNEDLLDLVILASEQDPKKVGKFLPYFVWFNTEGSVTRVFAKFQKGPTAIQIELISDKATSNTYFMMNIGSSVIGAGIQPSRTIHPSLAFADHMEGNIVFTNTTITKANFKCLTLVSDDVLNAGMHFVAKGPLQPQPVPVNPFTNPRVVVRIGIPEAGWTVPNLEVKIGLNGSFITDLDKQMTNYLFLASDAARKGLVEATEKIKEAKYNIRRAEVAFEKAKYPVQKAQWALNRVVVPGLESAKQSLSSHRERKTRAEQLRDENARKQLCGNPCIPYIYPKICYQSIGFTKVPYPCGVYTGLKCFRGCIPDPKGLAKAAFYASHVVTYQGWIAATTARLKILEESLKIAKIPFEQALRAVEETLEQAKRTLDAAKLTLVALEQSLVTLEQGYGELSDVAKHFLNKLARLVESSNLSFTTTLAVANSGTIKGNLAFDFKFRGGPKVRKSFEMNFSDPVGSVNNFAKTLIE